MKKNLSIYLNTRGTGCGVRGAGYISPKWMNKKLSYIPKHTGYRVRGTGCGVHLPQRMKKNLSIYLNTRGTGYRVRVHLPKCINKNLSHIPKHTGYRVRGAWYISPNDWKRIFLIYLNTRGTGCGVRGTGYIFINVSIRILLIYPNTRGTGYGVRGTGYIFLNVSIRIFLIYPNTRGTGYGYRVRVHLPKRMKKNLSINLNTRGTGCGVRGTPPQMNEKQSFLYT
jgi:hypothetical protein